MRFNIELKRERTLNYGHDHSIGWFGQIVSADEEREFATYDRLSPGYNRERPLDGLLRWIADLTALYTVDELEEILDALVRVDGDEIPRRMRVVAEVVINCQHAGRGP